MNQNLTREYAIETYPWGGNYRPKTRAVLTVLPEKGLKITMTCRESDPRAVYDTPDSPVCEDSCLECFIQFYPDLTHSYINFEVNANGCMLSAIVPDRNNRTSLRSLGIRLPEVQVTGTSDEWEVSYLVSFELVQKAYGQSETFRPEILKGNFYKCGDKTTEPHYGCWAEVKTENPDYHRPEWFRRLL